MNPSTAPEPAPARPTRDSPFSWVWVGLLMLALVVTIRIVQTAMDWSPRDRISDWDSRFATENVEPAVKVSLPALVRTWWGGTALEHPVGGVFRKVEPLPQETRIRLADWRKIYPGTPRLDVRLMPRVGVDAGAAELLRRLQASGCNSRDLPAAADEYVSTSGEFNTVMSKLYLYLHMVSTEIGPAINRRLKDSHAESPTGRDALALSIVQLGRFPEVVEAYPDAVGEAIRWTLPAESRETTDRLETALRHMGSKAIPLVPFLRDALSATNPWTKYNATRLLLSLQLHDSAVLDSTRSFLHLKVAVPDGDPSYHQISWVEGLVAAVIELGGDGAIALQPDLVQMLGDDTPIVRCHAEAILLGAGNIPESARGALERLQGQSGCEEELQLVHRCLEVLSLVNKGAMGRSPR